MSQELLSKAVMRIPAVLTPSGLKTREKASLKRAYAQGCQGPGPSLVPIEQCEEWPLLALTPAQEAMCEELACLPSLPRKHGKSSLLGWIQRAQAVIYKQAP